MTRTPAPAHPASLATLLRELVVVAYVLGGVGCVAIGASGFVAAGMASTFGARFVAGSPPGVTYTGERCAEFQEYYAGECEVAATAHHADEVVQYRLAAGALGLLALAAWLLLRRFAAGLVEVRHLPRGLAPAAGAGVFGGAAVLLLPVSTMQLLFGVPGTGALLSAGLVAFVMCTGYLVTLVRVLRGGRGQRGPTDPDEPAHAHLC